jgi:hypothetical protein
MAIFYMGYMTLKPKIQDMHVKCIGTNMIAIQK